MRDSPRKRKSRSLARSLAHSFVRPFARGKENDGSTDGWMRRSRDYESICIVLVSPLPVSRFSPGRNAPAFRPHPPFSRSVFPSSFALPARGGGFIWSFSYILLSSFFARAHSLFFFLFLYGHYWKQLCRDFWVSHRHIGRARILRYTALASTPIFIRQRSVGGRNKYDFGCKGLCRHLWWLFIRPDKHWWTEEVNKAKKFRREGWMHKYNCHVIIVNNKLNVVHHLWWINRYFDYMPTRCENPNAKM